MKTCQKLGIRTVAIYSEADENALHVKMANEAYLVGGSRVQESYLNLEKIIEIAKKTMPKQSIRDMDYYLRIHLFQYVVKKKESYLSVHQKKSLRRWGVKSNHVLQCKLQMSQ